ncbi:MAG: SurA N-terminal domain-containing protein [Desulfovibrio sp.]|uniref:SurA N-terminal domain-containing protein n=1 Tax=Desulfovibrio sp. 7SRBS1 TaxID=3378064 RepID=UPI003B3E3A26
MLDILRRNSQSWLIKVLFAVIILAFIITFGYSFNHQRGGAIAYVNETPVSRHEFIDRYKQTVDRLRSQMPKLDENLIKQMGLKRQVLSQVADLILMRQEAEKLGIHPANESIQEAILAIPAFQKDGKFDQEQYVRVLRANSLTPSQFEADMRQQQLLTTLRTYISSAAEVTEDEAREYFNFATEKCTARYAMFSGKDYESEVKPTDKDIQKFYDENSARYAIPQAVEADYIIFSPESLADPASISDADIISYYDLNKAAYDQDEQVKARHILVKVDKAASEADVEKAHKRIEAIRNKIKKPEDFAKVAESDSEGPSSVRGGELGWFNRGMMVPEFEEVAFSLKPGIVSEPVRTPFGWHLILVEDKKEKGIAPLEDVKEDIRLKLAQDKAAESMADLMDEATARLTLDEPLSKIAKELKLPLHSTGLVDRAQARALDGLDEEAVNAIFALNEGGATETPVAIGVGYLLAAKTKDKPASTKPLDEVKDDVINELKRQGGIKQALEAARSTLAELKDKATAEKAMKKLDNKLKVTNEFTRSGYVDGIGQNQAFVEAAFTTPENQWLPDAYETPEGAFIAKTEIVVPAPLSEWEKQQAAWMETLSSRKQQQMFQSYLANLRSTAKIEIADQDFFE